MKQTTIKFLSGACLAVLLTVTSSQADLLSAYNFNSGTTPVNVVTSNIGSTYASVASSTDVPIAGVGNRSLQLGTTAGGVGLASLPADQLIGANNQYTFSYWVKPTAELIANSGTLLSMGAGNFGITMGVNTSGQLAFWQGSYSYGTVGISPGTLIAATLAAGTWYNVAMRFESTVPPDMGITAIFINGVKVYDIYSWDRGGGAWDNTGWLGSVAPPPGVTTAHAYGSLIDDLRFYNAPISDAQIQADMLVAVGTYAGWATDNAGSQAANLDWDNDGVSNGVEFFMNAAPGFTANPGLDGSKKVTWTNGGIIPSSDYGIQFVVQTSADLTTWEDVAEGDLDTNTSGPAGSLSYIVTGEGKQFVRLKVTPN